MTTLILNHPFTIIAVLVLSFSIIAMYVIASAHNTVNIWDKMEDLNEDY